MKTIVISAINIFQGGPLSILHDCLDELSKNLYFKYRIIVFLHKKNLLNKDYASNFEFIELPNSRKSYLFRIYYEYFYFYEFSKKTKIDFWFSLHDISPRVISKTQAVYCHNPAPFRKLAWKELIYFPKYFLFTLFYKILYKVNIYSNHYVVVQQSWIKEEFVKFAKIDSSKIIIAKPNNNFELEKNKCSDIESNSFFYPAFPRPFKNFELICKSVTILNTRGFNDFVIYMTIDGKENAYTKSIYQRYNKYKQIRFIGNINRAEVFKFYSEVSALIFPSKLETWGLPISEFKNFRKPIYLADLPYAYETLGSYDKAIFFNADNPLDLSNIIEGHINNSLEYVKAKELNYEPPFANNWDELFKLLIDEL